MIGYMNRDYLNMKESLKSNVSILDLYCYKTEDHLKEMGICCIGHQLILVNGIDVLRYKAGLLPSAKFVNVRYLLEE